MRLKKSLLFQFESYSSVFKILGCVLKELEECLKHGALEKTSKKCGALTRRGGAAVLLLVPENLYLAENSNEFLPTPTSSISKNKTVFQSRRAKIYFINIILIYMIRK